MFNKITKGIKNLINEFRQVKWPSLRQSINLTAFVIIISAIITLLILGMDALFHSFMSLFIK